MKKLTFNKDGLTPYALYSDLYPMEKNSPYKDNLVNIKDVYFSKYKYDKLKNKVVYRWHTEKKKIGEIKMNQYGSRKATELTYEQLIFKGLSENPLATKEELAEIAGTTVKTITEYISKLKKKNKLSTQTIIIPDGKNLSLNVK